MLYKMCSIHNKVLIDGLGKTFWVTVDESEQRTIRRAFEGVNFKDIKELTIQSSTCDDCEEEGVTKCHTYSVCLLHTKMLEFGYWIWTGRAFLEAMEVACNPRIHIIQRIRCNECFK